MELWSEADLKGSDSPGCGILADLLGDPLNCCGFLQQAERESEARQSLLEAHPGKEAQSIRNVLAQACGQFTNRLCSKGPIEMAMQIGEGLRL
jgi:hypothetical protein